MDSIYEYRECLVIPSYSHYSKACFCSQKKIQSGSCEVLILECWSCMPYIEKLFLTNETILAIPFVSFVTHYEINWPLAKSGSSAKIMTVIIIENDSDFNEGIEVSRITYSQPWIFSRKNDLKFNVMVWSNFPYTGSCYYCLIIFTEKVERRKKKKTVMNTQLGPGQRLSDQMH